MSERTKFLGWLHITLSDELPAHEIEQMWTAWEASAATSLARFEAAEKDSAVVMKVQYIGACALLGRISMWRGLSEEDIECIARAMDDCAKLFPGRFEVVRTSGGGYSLEPVFAAMTKEPT